MASAPQFKIYSPDGEYVGALKHAEDAAALVALRGDGGTIRFGHRRVVWTEGQDGQAGESYDATAGVILDRVDQVVSRGRMFHGWTTNATHGTPRRSPPAVDDVASIEQKLQIADEVIAAARRALR